MDRFSEQLILKQTTVKDMLIRLGLIAAATVLCLAAAFFSLFFGFIFYGVIIIGGIIAGLVWLLRGTSTEYEYIVTNDTFDVDKITGRRKRKRLITVSLSEGKTIGEYAAGTSIDAEITVMAHDETGEGLYYFVCGTKEYGDLAIIFNPDSRTLYNIIGGFAPSVRMNYNELYNKLALIVKEKYGDPDDEEDGDSAQDDGEAPAEQDAPAEENTDAHAGNDGE
ncbi:MAG: hypothetical protein J6X60_11325 [Ruminiclostridium sp.]|nr:hypothetical protein [Ruminiclostridium sp.]